MKDFFLKLSSSDYIVVKQCDNRTKNRFKMVGFFVFVVGFLCFLSGLITFYGLFKSIIISLPFALFFSWMVSNIYLVLLSTLTKNSLPHIRNEGALLMSLIIRIVFLLLISVIISKPIESILLYPFTSDKIEAKKALLLENYESKLKQYYQNDFAKIETERLKAELTIKKSSFFIERIKQTNKLPFAWFLTLISMFLFLLPAAIKYFIAESNVYYLKKTKNDKRIILEYYEDFKSNYKMLMYERTGKIIEFKERFKDAPFNTKPISDNKTYKSEEDFINLIYKIEN